MLLARPQQETFHLGNTPLPPFAMLSRATSQTNHYLQCRQSTRLKLILRSETPSPGQPHLCLRTRPSPSRTPRGSSNAICRRPSRPPNPTRPKCHLVTLELGLTRMHLLPTRIRAQWLTQSIVTLVKDPQRWPVMPVYPPFLEFRDATTRMYVGISLHRMHWQRLGNRY